MFVEIFYFDYLLIKPWQDHPLITGDQQNSEIVAKFLLMGHRGCGKTNDRSASILENTMPSFYSAYSSGVPFVELDIQFTKDHVPIIFHDFHVSISTHNRSGISALLHVAVKDLTYEELTNLKTDFSRENAGTDYDDRYFSLFPTLSQTLGGTSRRFGASVRSKVSLLRFRDQ